MPEDQPKSTTAETQNDAAQPTGAQFHCASCGHEMSLPEQLLGRQAKCPKCGELGVVGRPRSPQREPNEGDVRLDDLVADAPFAAPLTTSASLQETAPGASGTFAARSQAVDPAALALTTTSTEQEFLGHLRAFFQGNPLRNVFAGLLGGVHLCLVCCALALLFFSLPQMRGAFPHALWAMLLPAVFATMLFALHGRLTVALGSPEPAAVAAVIFLVAAVGGEMQGHAPTAVVHSTMLAAVILAALTAGVVSVVFARLGVAERVRFLPPEVVGGMLAGFGILLVKLWAMQIAHGDAALTGLFEHPLQTNLAEALTASVWVWAPGVVFGVVCFVLQLASHNFLWTILAAACATGLWQATQLYSFPAMALVTEPFSKLPGIPMSLDGNQLLTLLNPATLAQVDWTMLGGRLELLIAIAALAFVPSMVRSSLLEVRQGRDVPPAEQLRVLGASHMLSGALGGLPASLSLSASLGMRSLGAAGPLAGFLAALVCLCFGLFGQRVVSGIPLLVPQGLLLSIALVMPVSWLLRDSKNSLSNTADTRIAWTCCLGTVLLGPALGILGSLMLGLSVSLRRAVIDGGVRFSQTGDVFHSNVDRSPGERRVLRELGGSILVLRLRGYLFLGSVFGLLGQLRNREGLKYALLDFSAVTGLGSSAATGFRRLEQYARERGMVLFFTSLPLEMEEHFEALGYRMGEDGLCRIALNLDYTLEWCEDQLLREAGALEDRSDTLEEMLAATFPEPRLVPVLLQCLERVEVPRKKPVFHQGDDSDSMYFLQSGKVHVELALPGGKLIRLKKMGPGTVFGEMGLYTSAPRSASVVAMEKCVLYRLSVERFTLIQAKAPQLAAAVNRFVVALLAERVAEENAKTRASQL